MPLAAPLTIPCDSFFPPNVAEDCTRRTRTLIVLHWWWVVNDCTSKYVKLNDAFFMYRMQVDCPLGDGRHFWVECKYTGAVPLKIPKRDFVYLSSLMNERLYIIEDGINREVTVTIAELPEKQAVEAATRDHGRVEKLPCDA